MTDIKLPQLPDRTPVKLSITVLPELHLALTDYAAIYAETYGRDDPLANLIPAMLTAFLESDRGFIRRRDALPRSRK